MTPPNLLDPAALAQLTLEEIKAIQEQAAQALKERTKAERSQALAQITTLVQLHGFTAEDLRGIAAKAKAASTSSRKAPAKYRDPATGATWSGRGVAPLWIRDKDRDAFLIPNTQPAVTNQAGPVPNAETQAALSAAQAGETESFPTVGALMDDLRLDDAVAIVPEDEPTPEQLGEAEDDAPAPRLFQTVIGGQDDDGSDPVADSLAPSSLFTTA